MKRVTGWLFDTKHPVRVAFVCLGIGLGNAYEAAYIDRADGFWIIVSWLCAAAGLLGFLGFLLDAASDYFSRTDD